ncbi:MAG TPA: hypothetical protein VGM37_15850 [Armatimonadota bacterium]|jgi:hypothetical protein
MRFPSRHILAVLAVICAPVFHAAAAPSPSDGPLVVDFGGAPPDAPVAGLDQWQRGFAPAPAADVTGTKEVVVLRVYFHDYANTSRYTKTQVDGFFNNDLNKLWQNTSYGKINIHAQVTDQYQLPSDRSHYITDHSDGDTSDGDQFDNVMNDAIDKSPAGIDWSNVDAVFVVMAETDATQFHRGQGGTGTYKMGPGGSLKKVGCGIFSENPSDSDVAVWGRWCHELGHAFQVGGPAHPSNYNNYFELMDHNMPGQTGVFEKQANIAFPGWMPPAKYQVITPAQGGDTAIVWAEEYNPAGQPNIQAVKATISGNLYYLISVRRRINGDDLLPDFGIPGIPDEGVLIERVSEGSDPWVTVVGKGGDRNVLWKGGDTYSNTSDGIYIAIEKVDVDNYRVIVRFNGDFAHQPDVMINPWTSPPGNTWETTDIWVDSPLNGYGVFRYGTWDDGTGNQVPRGNGDDPAIGQVNRLYVRVRNIGFATATNVTVHVERTDPPGLGINGASGWVPVTGSAATSTIDSSSFPALASLAAGATADVNLNWTPNFAVPPGTPAGDAFFFHTCIRVKIDPVPGETVLGNQDGDREQENIDYFQASPGTPGPSHKAFRLRNDDPVNPKWFHLAYQSDVPPAWGLDVNGGQLAVRLDPGEVREIPVTITPVGPAVVGGTFGVDVSANYFRDLVNTLNPSDKHMEFKPLGGVRVETHVNGPTQISCTATQESPRQIRVDGKLTGIDGFIGPNSPLFVFIEGLDVRRDYLPETGRLVQVNLDGTFTGHLNGDTNKWCPYEAMAMFAGTDMLASAAAIAPIANLTPPVRGDMTGDCVLDMTDITEMLRVAGGLDVAYPGQIVACDTDGDGQITCVDAVAFLRGMRVRRGGAVTRTPTNAYSTYGVYIDDPLLNGQPDVRLVTSHRFIAAYNTPVGVWYDSGAAKWVVYNEDLSAMSNNEVFGYYFGERVKSAPATGAFVVKLDDPGFTGNPSAIPLAVHDFVAAYNPSPVGLIFDTTAPQPWYAYNESGTAMASGEPFFYMDAGASGGRAFHYAYNDYFGYGVYLDDPRLNGNPGATVIAQHGYQSAINASAVGVWYDFIAGKWIAYNETRGPLATGEAIHYLVVSN